MDIHAYTETGAALLWTKGTNDYLEPLDEVGKDWGTHVHLAKSLDKLLHSALLHYQSVPSLEVQFISRLLATNPLLNEHAEHGKVRRVAYF